MEKKILSFLMIVVLGLSMSACADSAGSTSTQTKKNAKQEEKKPVNLTGTWKSENKNGSWMEADIKDDVITINWVSDNGDTKSIYWIGTYEAPTKYSEQYKWTSKRDKEKTKNALLASQDDSKEITYEDGKISYEASALGSTTKVKMTKEK